MPEESFLALGLWQPATAIRRDVTDTIANHPEDWKRAISERQFKSKTRLMGASLARLPKQYDPSHPFAADLQRKDFVASANFTRQQVCAKDFLDRVESICQSAKPFLEFLATAAGLKW